MNIAHFNGLLDVILLRETLLFEILTRLLHSSTIRGLQALGLVILVLSLRRRILIARIIAAIFGTLLSVIWPIALSCYRLALVRRGTIVIYF